MYRNNMELLIIKRCLVILYIFSICQIVLTANFTTAGYGEKYEEEEHATVINDLSGDEGTTEFIDLKVETRDRIVNLSRQLRFQTPCETPNLDPGICVEIKQCEVLSNSLYDKGARDFLRSSRCGPENEDRRNPKVCCGKFGNYLNASKNENAAAAAATIEDNKIFPKVCGTQRVMIRGRIMGGKQAYLGEFPWMTRLIHKNRHGYKTFGCSGFLIHTKYVVTAAHCVHKNFTHIRGAVFSVVLGEHNSETKFDCSPGGTYCAEPLQISRVAKVIVHPEYDPHSGGHYNDIALLHLNKGAKITEYVRPICILPDSSEVPDKYTISGWGKTDDEIMSKIKMKVDLLPFDHEECSEKYSLLDIYLKETQMCVGGEKNKDSCNGDSGGPLMMSPNGTVWFAAGIVSYGVGCGYEGWPGVYTNLPHFIPWIKQQIIQNSLVSSRNNKVHHKHKNVQENTTKTD